MSYIQELRSFIGHRPIIMVGASVLVCDEQGRLLMNFRPDNHCWGIPGGAMEPGERIEETARRETREETGLELGIITIWGVFSGPEFYYCYPNQDEVYNITVVFTCSEFSGDLDRSNEESLALRFFHPGEIVMDQVSPPVRPILRRWIDQEVQHEQN